MRRTKSGWRSKRWDNVKSRRPKPSALARQEYGLLVGLLPAHAGAGREVWWRISTMDHSVHAMTTEPHHNKTAKARGGALFLWHPGPSSHPQCTRARSRTSVSGPSDTSTPQVALRTTERQTDTKRDSAQAHFQIVMQIFRRADSCSHDNSCEFLK